jgi:hypothetical protein
MRWFFIFLACVLIPRVGASAPALYDMGTSASAVWDGFTRVTAQSIFTPDAGFGWESGQGLRARAQAYEAPVHNASRGSDEPPPIWTNAITEDAILGEREDAFLARLPPGAYELYIVCGTSEAMRSQYFDFDVQVGQERQRLQFEGGYRFHALRFRTMVRQEPLAVRFIPRSKWVVNAILAYPLADAQRMQQQVIAPFEQSTWRMPPDQWAKWKEDPRPAPDPMPPLNEAMPRANAILYARHYLECIYPDTRPRAEEIVNPAIRIFATPGEYEPATFTLLPLADVSGVRVAVSDIGPVPAGNIEVRRVRYSMARPNYRVNYRYRIVPDILERVDRSARLDLKAGENTTFWLTVRVPEDAPPGIYNGTIRVGGSRGAMTLPITLRILPFKLREDPARLFAIYYRHPYDLLAGATDDVSRDYFRRRADLEHADMAAHGTRNITLSCYSPPADAQGNFRFNFDLLDQKLALWKKHEFRGPVVMSINTGGVYQKYMKERFGSHLRGVKDPPEAFSREITAMVRAIEAERTRRGWPEFLYYPVDEPSTEAASVNFMVKVLQACRAAGVRTYVTADPTHEQFAPMRPYIDVWCTQPFAPDRQTIQADMKARGVEYWCYPNHVNGENDHTPVAGARMTYGFGFWRSGFLTLIPWIYSYSNGDPFNYLDGSAMDFFNRHEPDGTPMPVAMWEAYREGYDDYRYIHTLQAAIAEARAGGQPAAISAADAAQRELQWVWDAIRVLPKYKDEGLWAPAEFDVYRWIIARQIMALQEAAR